MSEPRGELHLACLFFSVFLFSKAFVMALQHRLLGRVRSALVLASALLLAQWACSFVGAPFGTLWSQMVGSCKWGRKWFRKRFHKLLWLTTTSTSPHDCLSVFRDYDVRCWYVMLPVMPCLLLRGCLHYCSVGVYHSVLHEPNVRTNLVRELMFLNKS